MKLDVYRGVTDPTLRMAVEHGKGLPPHVSATDWKLMPSGESQIIEDAVSDIEARGFCFFKLV
jgi:hypothetical protein